MVGFTADDAEGRIEVASVAGYTDLKEVRIVASFRFKRGDLERVIGEDQNLDGDLDAGEGEDTNGNNRLDSPVEIVTLIAR